jgi:V-type H+-transporting ATPase subunit H
MSGYSPEAREVIEVAQQLKLADAGGIATLTQLFSNRVNSELARALVMGKEQSLARLLFNVAKGTTGAGPLGYTLRFMADLAQLCPAIAGEIASPQMQAENGGKDPLTVFADAMDGYRDDYGVFSPAVYLLALGLSLSPTPRDGLVQKFLAVCHGALTPNEVVLARVEYVICAACEFLRRSEYRPVFLKAGLIPCVPRLLGTFLQSDSPLVAHCVYELLLAARLLSFDVECMMELHSQKIIPVCHRVLQKTTKENCTRMALYVLRNYAKMEQLYRTCQSGTFAAHPEVHALARANRGRGPTFLLDMAGVGIAKTLTTLQKKKYGDEDIITEMEWLSKALEAVANETTSWGEYKGELESGALEWTPHHTSAKFWREHVKDIEDRGFEVVKEVASLILTSHNELTLAVACNDLGEMVRAHPSGNLLITMPALQGVKERVLALMASPNHEVAKAALGCIQKILVLRWDHQTAATA